MSTSEGVLVALVAQDKETAVKGSAKINIILPHLFTRLENWKGPRPRSSDDFSLRKLLLLCKGGFYEVELIRRI